MTITSSQILVMNHETDCCKAWITAGLLFDSASDGFVKTGKGQSTGGHKEEGEDLGQMKSGENGEIWI